MSETIVVAALVLLAAGMLGKRIHRNLTAKDGGCGCGGGGGCGGSCPGCTCLDQAPHASDRQSKS